MIAPAFSNEEHATWSGRLADTLTSLSGGDVARVAGSLQISTYDGDSIPPTKLIRRRPFSEAFGTTGALIDAARAGRPAAAEAGLQILIDLDPARAVAFALDAQRMASWPELREVIVRALVHGDTEQAFDALFEMRDDTVTGAFLLRKSAYRGGCEKMLRWLEQSRCVADLSTTGPEGVRDAQTVISYLGAKRCVASRGLIARLYREHAHKNIRLSAGHALADLGDPESLELLISLGDSDDERRRFFAIKAAMARDPSTSSDVVEACPPGRNPGEHASAAFRILEIDREQKSKGERTGEPWVLADPRWPRVLARWALKGDETASHALNAFAPETRKAALAEAEAERKPAAMKRPTAGGKTKSAKPAKPLVVAGEPPSKTWERLVALGEAVRDAEHFEEATAFAARTMKTARANLELFVERLRKSGYVFSNKAGVLLDPPKDVRGKLDELETISGPLPLSLRAAYEHMGSCDLSGDHPEWPRSAEVNLRPAKRQSLVWMTDPFVLVPIDDVLTEVSENTTKGAPYWLSFAGDALTKAGYSGGVYEMRVPCEAADEVVRGEPKKRTFVEHLRTCMEYGGFAGFASIEGAPQSFIAALVKGAKAI